MGLASNRNKKGMTLLGDCLAIGGKFTPRGCETEGNAQRNDYFIRRGAQHASDNQGRGSTKSNRNCSTKTAAHGTPQGPCLNTNKKAGNN